MPLGIRRMPSIYLFKRGSDTNMLVLLILLIVIALQMGTLKVWERKGGELKKPGLAQGSGDRISPAPVYVDPSPVSSSLETSGTAKASTLW